MSFSVQRLSGALGAEIEGVDLAQDLSNATFDAIHTAFLDHAVLVFRNQKLTPPDQVGFARRFGPLEQHVLKDFALPGNPDVFIVSNRTANGKPRGAIRAGQYWHSDLSYMERPTLVSMLHALEVPSYGGDTLFASMTHAHDALSERMRGMLDGLTAVHDYTLAYETFFSRHAERPPLTPEQVAQVPPVVHPVLRTHPETGRKALFVNPGFTRCIRELSDDESRALLDFLFAHAARHEFIYRHRWRAGDVVLWDNRCTMHNAVADYDMAEPRHMHRTSVQGDRPV